MRSAIILCSVLFLGCDEGRSQESQPEAVYASGVPWKPNVPVSPGRAIPRDLREWDRFIRESGIQGDPATHLFTPTWVGFSVAPAGDLRYHDFGDIVAIWAGVDGTGTSNATSFSISGMPESIRPTGQRSSFALVMDNGLEAPGRIVVDTDGTAFFQREVVSGGNLQYSTTAFTAANVKGLVVGAVIFYTK